MGLGSKADEAFSDHIVLHSVSNYELLNSLAGTLLPILVLSLGNPTGNTPEPSSMLWSTALLPCAMCAPGELDMSMCTNTNVLKTHRFHIEREFETPA